MMLRAVGPCASEPTFKHAQLEDPIGVELPPSMRCAASTLAADLKPEQTLDATTDPVVVRLHRSRASSLVYELDEALVNDRPHEVVIHRVTAETLPSEVPVQPR